MSAIALLGDTSTFNSKAFLIGMHADHRPQDIYFARTQSPASSKLQWESRLKPLNSWGQIAVWVIAIVMFVSISASLVR